MTSLKHPNVCPSYFVPNQKSNLAKRFHITGLNSLLLALALLISGAALTQPAAGDYRSNAATMNWNASASWQKYNGTAWAASTDYPGQNACSGCTVTIQNGNTVTLNVSPANSVGNIVVGGGTNGTLTLGTFSLTDAGNLTVNTGATLNLATGTLTVAGTTTTAGTISDLSNTGVNTFTGMVTKTAGTWTSTAVTTASNMFFYGGITNTAGGFSAGAATIADNQTITGTVNVSFVNGLTILGNGDITIGGTTGAGVTFGGTAINYAVRNLTLTGLLTVSTTGDLTVSGATSLTGSGAFNDNNNTGITSFAGTVTHASTGSWTSTTVMTPANMVFTSGFTNTSGAFNAGAATITDNQTLTGTVNMTFTGGLAVTGNGDLNIAGTASQGVTFGGTGINYAVRNLSLTGLLTVSTTGNLTVSGTTNITGTGAFSDNNNAGITSFAGLVTHNSTGSWSSTTVSTPANMVFTSGFTNTAGAFNAGGATISDNQTLTGTVNMAFSGGLTILGNGDLTIAGTATTGATFGGTAINYAVRNLTLTGRLTVSTTGNLTVSGTTSITGTGAFWDNNNAGVTSFTGPVTHNSTGAWTSTAVTTAANMVFTAGFTNTAGSFNAGGATVTGGQTLTGTILMIFYNPLSITGSGDLTITGAGGVRFSGTAMNYVIPGNLTLTGTLLVNTSGNFTVSGTTSITGAGDFTDNNNTGVSTFTGLVTHNSTGRWVSSAVTTPANMIFTSGFTNTAGTFSAGGATVGDNQTLTGTVNMSFSTGITVTGNADLNIAGTATTGVTMAGAATVHYTFRNLSVTGLLTVSTQGNLTVNGTTTLSGTSAFLDNNGTGISTFTGLVTVGSTSTFTATSVTTVGRLVFAGGIVQNNTTALAFNAGTIRTSATQTWSGAGDIRSAGVTDVNAGTLTNNLGGTAIVVGTLTGTTFVQGTNAKLSLGSTTPLTITTLTSTATGNMVTYNGGSATMRSQTYYHLTIAGSGNKIISTTDITVNGNLTISSGVLSNTTNNRNIVLAGNWINNVGAAGYTAGTGTVTFSGTSAQTIGGTGNTTFRNLILNNAAGINQTISTTITGVLTFTSGIITTGSSTVIISSTGSVSRTSGYIYGNEQRNIATGVNVARTFDIGDATNYTPVTLTFASVSVAGNVTVKTTATDHPLLVSAYLDGTLSINRYWTLTNVTTTFTNYSAVFNFIAADKDASTNTANLIAGRYSGSWSYPTVGTKTSTSTQVTGITAFGDIALAEQLPCTTPTLIITNPAPFCSPATVNLTAAAVTAGSTSGLTYTYWTDAAATLSLASPSAIGTAGTYYIKGKVSLGGCSDVQPVVVTRNNPTGVLSGTATICSGSSAVLSIAVTGTGPWSGTLSSGAAFSGSTDPVTVSVTPGSNTTYTISTLTDAGCNAQAGDKTGSAVITLSAAPTPANAGPDQSICGVSATLAANTPVTGTGSWSIISGSGGSFAASTSPTSSFSGTAGTTYVLRWSITNAPCAVSTDDVTIDFTSGVWTGTVDTDWNNSGNWCGGSVPSGTIDLTLTGGLPNYPAIAGNIVVNDISIAAGASISITSTGSLSISGVYSNSGTITNNGAIILNGSAQQSFPGSAATVAAMKDLEVDNAAGVLIDQSFSLTGTLTPTLGTIDLVDKNITLASNSSGTARVASVGGGFDYTAGGKFIVQRYIAARRAWRLITAPVTNSNTIYDSWQNSGVYSPGAGTLITGPAGGFGLDAASGSSLKVWDVSTQTLSPVASTLVSVSPGTSGSADNTGYFLFVRGDRNTANYVTANTNATTLSSAGQLQTGAQAFTASSVAGNFTLIGNPYASPIDFNNISRTNLIKRFYVWDPSLNTVGGYVMLDDIDNDGAFSSSVSGSAQTSELLSHQAFFVETAAAGSASLTINESDKTDGGTYAVARPAVSPAESLNVNLYLLNADNTTILADGVKAEFDNAYSDEVNAEDALKFANVNETFALLRHSKALTLERRPGLQVTDTLFLKLTRTTQRNYQLIFTPRNLDNNGLTGILKDNYLGTETTVGLNDLTTVDFSVNADPASAAANRFMIIFRTYQVLPVGFTSVKAYRQQKGIAVEWKVNNGINTVKYEVERSADGNHFSNIKTLIAKTGNAAAAYSIVDENPSAGNNFYRIRSVEPDGKATYSQTVNVLPVNNKTGISIYPNPLENNTINLQFSNQPAGKYTVVLTNAGGQVIYTTAITTTGGNASHAVLVNTSLTKGTYQVEVTGAGSKTLQQVLVQ